MGSTKEVLVRILGVLVALVLLTVAGFVTYASLSGKTEEPGVDVPFVVVGGTPAPTALEITAAPQVEATDPPLETPAPSASEQLYRQAAAAMEKGEYETALDILNKCVALTDETDAESLSETWLKKASVFMLMERQDEAIAALNTALEHNPTASQALLLRAQLEVEQQLYGRATEDLEMYLALVPEDAKTRLSLAQIYETLGKYTQASACYDEVYGQNLADESARLNALRCLFLAGDYVRALNGFETYLTDGGKAGQSIAEENTLRSTALFLRGACLMMLGRYEEAIGSYEEAKGCGYDEGACLEQVVACQYASEAYEDALKSGQRLLQLGFTPTVADAFYQRMGVASMSLEQYENAVEYLTHSIEASASLDGNHYYRGVSLLMLERHEEAVADFTKSIEEGFLRQYCYYNRGVCYVRLKDYEKAAEDMRATLSSGNEQSLKDAANNVLGQIARYNASQETDE